MIRFQRIGRTNAPAFRIVVLEKERAAKAGNVVEQLGTYNPRSKALTFDEEQVKYWISKGAQPTGSIHNLLINKGVITGKKVNVLSKKTPQKSEEAIAAEAAAAAEAVAAAKSAKAAAAAPTEAEVLPATSEADVLPDAASAEAVPVEEVPVVEETSVAEAVAEETPAEAPVSNS